MKIAIVIGIACAACLALGAQAVAAGRFTDNPCLIQTGAAGTEACARLAREVSHDIDAARSLGDELERSGRYDDAAKTYEIALESHPNHRNLLQRLIKARGASRSLRMLTGANEVAPLSNSNPAQSPPPSTTAQSLASKSTPPVTSNAATAGVPPKGGFSFSSKNETSALRATAPTVAAAPNEGSSFSSSKNGASPLRATPVPGTDAQAKDSSSAAGPTAAARAASTSTGTVAPSSSSSAREAAPLSAPVAAAPAESRNIALVIGNERYSDFTSLQTPTADARAMGSVLSHDYGFEVTTLTNATRYQIVSALSRLRREATENDSVLIYYAGHGYLDDATSRGYWLPVDAERDSVANWLSTSDITDVLAGLQARHALILADSCFSGALLRSDPTVSLDERQSLLKKLAAQRSRSIMTSGGLEPVIDNGGGRNSIFAAALIRALKENKNTLEAGRLFMQIRDRVSINASQTPQYGPLRNAGHDGGDFIFTRNSSSRR